MPFEAPHLKEHSYIKAHQGMNPTHDLDREVARSIVHNIVFDPKNPEIANNPFLNKRKEAEPRRQYDKKSLFLCGQSDMDLT